MTMKTTESETLDVLSHLPLPLSSVGINITVRPEQVAHAALEALQTSMSWGIPGDHIRRSEFSIVRIGAIAFAAGRTSPLRCCYAPADIWTAALCYAGAARYQSGIAKVEISEGESLLFPNSDGHLDHLTASGLGFQVDRSKLSSTMLTISGGTTGLRMDRPFMTPGYQRSRNRSFRTGLFALFHYIDSIIHADPYLANGMALDEQIYRTLAFHCFQAQGDGEAICRRANGSRRWSSSLDDLVDYIRTHSATNLSLTDLEKQSNYSARQLQKLFQARFGCSPMQFVRNQRLSLAMQMLRNPRSRDSVSRVARDCGYHFASNFSVDFKKEFGVSPSAVLRQTRGRNQPQPHR